MSEPIDWLPDGTPYSPRFGDRYHSESGLSQARDVFLHGCGLPGAWAGQRQWRILETGFGLGLNFLATWAAWRADPERPALLHFVSTEAWPVAADALLQAHSGGELAPLANELAAQFWGLLPGVHRLAFDGGRVLLTLLIGDTQALLRQQQGVLVADSVYLDGFSPRRNPGMWDADTLRAVARCCRRGTRLATWSVAASVRQGLLQNGFAVQRVPGVPPKRANLHATFDPRWEPRGALPQAYAGERRCLVIGAGLAGASVAASLARRGWQVEVLDQGSAPATGASGLPAGLICPHTSPDDGQLSRTTRAGARTTLHWAGALLRAGEDWAESGVLEHCVDGRLALGEGWLHGPGADWSRPATPAQLQAAHLPPGTPACWHARAGWLRPARLA
ncbi:MAG: tRNA (5-methylaminomethyl-2-thiouridine)(34)-methyltransferase MnmD, partial [Acidovorax sp.]|uniref:tRNA (5-methylaminomethyl-2-thiouridine)(34)-methyltransferase MnmD n=1 Tax=Acidovorax sp. TaxID=1872122 RepID=UPI0039E26B99